MIEIANIYINFSEIMKEEYKDLIEFLNDEHIFFKDVTKEINKLKQQLEQKNKVIEKARKRLGSFADEMGQNGNAYVICVDVLDILNKGVNE